MIRDGAYGTLLAPLLRGGEAADELCLREPSRVVEAHLQYVRAGARVLQSNSFLAWRFGDRRRRELLRAALECADDAVASAGAPAGAPLRVMATLGPAGAKPRDFYADLEQLLDAGRTLLTCETVGDATTARAFCAAWSEVAPGVDAVAVLSLTVAPSAGLDSWRWIGELALPASVEVGLNCCEGPSGLEAPLAMLAELGVPVHLAPSAGLPRQCSDTGPEWPLGPAAWAEQTAALATVARPATVGGCCGTTPAHIAALGELAGTWSDCPSTARERQSVEEKGL